MDPSGVNRTSKHKKKFVLPVQDQLAVDSDQIARIFDVPIGGVNADHLAHGRGFEENEERRGGRDGSPRMVNTLGPEIALSTTDSHSIY